MTCTYVVSPALKASCTLISSSKSSSSGIRKDPSISCSIYPPHTTGRSAEVTPDLYALTKTLAPGCHPTVRALPTKSETIKTISLCPLIPVWLFIPLLPPLHPSPPQMPLLILTGFLKPFWVSFGTHAQSSAKSPVLNIYYQFPLYFLASVELQLLAPIAFSDGYFFFFFNLSHISHYRTWDWASIFLAVPRLFTCPLS